MVRASRTLRNSVSVLIWSIHVACNVGVSFGVGEDGTVSCQQKTQEPVGSAVPAETKDKKVLEIQLEGPPFNKWFIGKVNV